MPSTIAQLETRLSQRLGDVGTGNIIWQTPALDEAIRSALEEYNQAAPRHMETVITLPGTGREIALSGIDGLLDVVDAWWPYATTGSEVWPPNQVKGFRLWWDDGQAVLFLDGADQTQPQANDGMRVWYTKPHTIQNLDAGAVTTLPLPHEGRLLDGAAGHALSRRFIERAGQIRIDSAEWQVLENSSKGKLRDFRAWLETLRQQGARSGQAWPQSAWSMDTWESRQTGRRDF